MSTNRPSAFFVVLEIRPCCDVDAVVVRGCKRPRPRGMRVVGDAPTRSKSGCDAGLGLIRRDGNVDVEAAPAGLRWIEFVEPQVRVASVPVDGILVAEILVPEGRNPERANVGALILRDGDADDLHLRRVGFEPEFPRSGGDPPSDLDIDLAKSAVFS